MSSSLMGDKGSVVDSKIEGQSWEKLEATDQ